MSDDARANDKFGSEVALSWLRHWHAGITTNPPPPEVCGRVLAQIDRLRAELDRHRVAGDAMADELDQSTGISDPDVQRLTHAWRSVRGDAPAVGGDTE